MSRLLNGLCALAIATAVPAAADDIEVPAGGRVTITMPGGGVISVPTAPPDDPDPPARGQCDPAAVPALARQFGMTTLAFCEDFSDPSRINLTGTQLGQGQTFVQNHIFKAKANPPERFKIEDGILRMHPVNANYQAHLITTSKGGGSGFQLRGGGWYVEARLKHDARYRQWPCTAFWSMDADHLYGPGNKNFLEPDFWENINGSETTSLHMHYRPLVEKKRESAYFQRPLDFDPTQWFTVGATLDADLTTYRWHRDGKVTGSKSPPWLSMFREFNGPLMIGSGPNCPLQVDYIRAWKVS